MSRGNRAGALGEMISLISREIQRKRNNIPVLPNSSNAERTTHQKPQAICGQVYALVRCSKSLYTRAAMSGDLSAMKDSNAASVEFAAS